MSEKLTIQEFARGVAEKLGMSKGNAEAFVKDFFQLIADALYQDKYVKIKGFGTFKLIEVDSRSSVNVNTGERIEIRSHTKISFTPDSTLRDVINRPFAHFETVPLNNEELLLSTTVEEEPISEEETLSEHEAIMSPNAEELSAPIKADDNPPKKEAIVDETTESQAVETAEEIAERKNTMKYFIGIVIFISLLCIGVLVFIYFPGLTRALYGLKEPITQSVDSVTLPACSSTSEVLCVPHALDTLELPVDSSASVPSVSLPSSTDLPSSAIPEDLSSVSSDSSVYEIVGTLEPYTIKEGETLTRVSLHYWGTKKLWPYLVKHNPTVIKNPDNVPYGTIIQIPKLKKK